MGNHEFDQGYDDLVNRVMAPYDATTNPWVAPTGSTSAPTCKLEPTGCRRSPPTWIKDFGGVAGRLRRRGDRGPAVAGLAAGIAGSGHRHRRRGQRRPPTSSRPTVPTSSSCSSTRVRRPPRCAVGHRPEQPPSARSSTASTPTSTRSSPVTRTWPTTTRSRCPLGDRGTGGHRAVRWSRPASTARTSTSWSSPSTASRRGRRSQASCRMARRRWRSRPPRRFVANYPADPAVTGDRRRRRRQGRRARRGGARQDRRTVQPGQAHQRHHREPRWRVDARQPGRRGPALGDRAPSRRRQIAFMNPGGLRADMVGNRHGWRTRATLTYKQAAIVQPFANTLVNMDLTGAQIKTVLEQQWQPTPAAVRRGRSCGSASRRASPTPTTRPAAEGDRITACGSTASPIDPAHDLLGDGQLVPGLRRRQLPAPSPTAPASRTPARSTCRRWSTTWPSSPTPCGDARCRWTTRSARSGVDFPASAPASYAAGGHGRVRPLVAGDDRSG